MTEPAQLALIAMVGSTLIAVVAAYLKIKTAIIESARESNHRANMAAAETEKIHVLVNSNLTAVKDDLLIAKEEIKSLRQAIARLLPVDPELATQIINSMPRTPPKVSPPPAESELR